MSEFNDSEPFAAAGSGKSEAEVAFELVSKLKGQGVWGERNQSAILDMYAECLDAVKGLRAYEGQKRVNVPIAGPQTTAPSAPAQSPVQAPVHTSTAQPATAPVAAPAPGPAPAGQTVQAQQEQVQQYQAQQQALRQG
ncbi:MAG: hypothetical protein HKN36_08795 [Hellea sp.]|nr:hypothetical protein [Hellea sp.]